jgi:hypothetical protein
MFGRSFLAFTLAFGSISCVSGQLVNPQPKPPLAADYKPINLKLILRPDDVRDGIPQGFTFVLLNISDHEVRVPARASVNCGNSYDGSFWLEVLFTPFQSSTPPPPQGGWGCSGSRYNWPPILDRVKEWKTLRPGESFSISASKEALHLDGKPGKYEFWGTYVTPGLSPDNENMLQNAGIDFPRGSKITAEYPRGGITSAHITLVSKH